MTETGWNGWTLVKEAEQKGLVVSMTGVVERVRTKLNDTLSEYFRNNVPLYSGGYDEDVCEEILDSINLYLEENHIDMQPLEFPISSGINVYLVPITENIKLKVLVGDEYHGSGDYSKYVLINFFIINEKTKKEDVDVLISFVNKYIEEASSLCQS
ncbi:hypothetical protein NDS46_31235 (plasmid) [Paenibacillus thiaminolyticus]|uniref:hypothetical protein n=1 Tax=Paenibacillus thiaminolyticus TaxID=49283 RepID=UPI00232AD4C2|nr:hypothetical protein [Paenibacillus thiaminolyticus]WCF11433.1 hypothetical protein NDS46_31235 [Paenibacillus thiaminolyticus]